jgi:hypothetical protein
MLRQNMLYLGQNILYSPATDAGTETAIVGLSGKKIAVHKKDMEGVLEIDALTGQVLPEQHDRPEWADGLVLAQLTERHSYYLYRLGPAYPEELKAPDLLAFEDLAWLGAETATTDANIDSEDAGVYELEADAEFRLDTIARILGIERDPDKAPLGLQDGEVEIMQDNSRTTAEQQAFMDAQEERFSAATGTTGGQ